MRQYGLYYETLHCNVSLFQKECGHSTAENSSLSQDHYFSNQYYQTLFPVLFTCSPLFISSFLSLFQKQVIFPPHTIPTFSPIFLSNLFESLFPVFFFKDSLFLSQSSNLPVLVYVFVISFLDHCSYLFLPTSVTPFLCKRANLG